MSRVAIVLTSHDEIGANGESTGVWIEELATPYYRLLDAGHRIQLYSPVGGAVSISPQSLIPPAGTSPAVTRWQNDPRAIEALATTAPLSALDVAAIDALLVPGGHGALWDLVDAPALTRAVEALLADGRVVAAICHGPAALVRARRSDGRPWVTDRTVATFTNEEEHAAGLSDAIPLALETAFEELGATVQKAPPFKACAVRDGNLITGQNPASAERFAELLLAALAEESPTTAG
ncbi:MAG: type 1 glutamine amidotransferase domain-containing protein [Pseudomonadota bacterium]